MQSGMQFELVGNFMSHLFWQSIQIYILTYVDTCFCIIMYPDMCPGTITFRPTILPQVESSSFVSGRGPKHTESGGACYERRPGEEED